MLFNTLTPIEQIERKMGKIEENLEEINREEDVCISRILGQRITELNNHVDKF